MLSLLPKGIPTGKEGFQFAQGQGDMGGCDETPQTCKGRADSCLLSGWINPLLHQLNAGVALSSLPDAVKEQGSKLRALSTMLPPQYLYSFFLSIAFACIFCARMRLLIASCEYESMSWSAVGLLPSKRNLMFLSDELRARNLRYSDIFVW